MRKFLQKMREAGINKQSDLAQILQYEEGFSSFHPSIISRWADGSVKIPTQTSIAIVRVLRRRGIDTSVEQLFGDEIPSETPQDDPKPTNGDPADAPTTCHGAENAVTVDKGPSGDDLAAGDGCPEER